MAKPTLTKFAFGGTILILRLGRKLMEISYRCLQWYDTFAKRQTRRSPKEVRFPE